MTKQPALQRNFWRKKPLDAFSEAEWEAVCDGCGKCCLLKLEDEDSAEVAYTSVTCRLYDPETCRCGSYELRHQLVPQCVRLTPETVRGSAKWMPRTCAYRLLAENKPLPEWHPLVSGDAESVHAAGVSTRSIETVPEYETPEDELEDYVIDDEL